MLRIAIFFLALVILPVGSQAWRSPKSPMIETCSWPKPTTGAIVVAVDAVEGRAHATVTIGGDDIDTRVGMINIESGDEPLFVLAKSSTAMIWMVSGAVDRIEKFVLLGSFDGSVGLATDKVVTTKTAGCDPSQPSFQYRNFPDVGRATNQKVDAGRIARISLPSGIQSPEAEYPNTQKPRISSITREVWQDLQRSAPGGIVDILPDKVVSANPAIPYGVMPKEAGLVQLLEKGAIVVEEKAVVQMAGNTTLVFGDNRYKIVKKTRIPAALSGGDSVSFVLGKGVPFPEGNLGRSGVLSEQTGETVDTAEALYFSIKFGPTQSVNVNALHWLRVPFASFAYLTFISPNPRNWLYLEERPSLVSPALIAPRAAEHIRLELFAAVKREGGRGLIAKEVVATLDTNGDGILSDDELSGPIAELLNDLDLNDDGEITISEIRRVQSIGRLLQRRQSVREQHAQVLWDAQIRAKSCGMPRPPSETTFVALSFDAGRATASVGVGSTDLHTRAGVIEIEPGNAPLFVTAVSRQSMLWIVKGDTQRVVGFVAASHTAIPGQTLPSVGVTGLPMERVSIVPNTSCLLQFHGDQASEERTSRDNAVVFGRIADRKVNAQELGKVFLPSGRLDLTAPFPQTRVLPKSEAWNDMLRETPAGVAEIEARDVVSVLPAIPYQQLPGLGGIAELVDSGALVPVARTRVRQVAGPVRIIGDIDLHGANAREWTVPKSFRIEKMMRYPADLVQDIEFFRGPNVPVSEGKPGRAKVTRDGVNAQ